MRLSLTSLFPYPHTPFRAPTDYPSAAGTPWWKIFVPISDASDDIFYDRLANLDDWDDEYDDEEDYGDTLSGYGTNNSGTENDTADENEQ